MGGPSAWRLNKAEQNQVKKDLAEWEAQNAQLREEARDEEVFQEAKH